MRERGRVSRRRTEKRHYDDIASTMTLAEATTDRRPLLVYYTLTPVHTLWVYNDEIRW